MKKYWQFLLKQVLFAVITIMGGKMNLKLFRKRTAYGADKINKMQNYTYLNSKYCHVGQTVLAGDSITEIYNHTEFFASYREKTGLEVYNRGISGDTSDRLLERWADNVLSLKPKNIVLLIGTNDSAKGATANFVADNVKKIIYMTKKDCPDARLILEAVYPINKKIKFWLGRSNKKIKEINSVLEALAKKEGITFIDLTSDLSDSGGCLNPDFTYDGLHLNANGFEKVTDRLLEIL